MKKNAVVILLLSLLAVTVYLRLQLTLQPAAPNVSTAPSPFDTRAPAAPSPTPVVPTLDYASCLMGDKYWIGESTAEHAFKAEILELLWRQRYDDLDTLATRWRDRPTAFIHGWTVYDTFLAAFRDASSPQAIQLDYLRLQEWELEKPASEIAPLAAAEFALAHCRTQQQWARELVLVATAERMAPKDPAPWVTQMEVPTWAHGSRQSMEKAFSEAISRDKYYYPAYYTKLMYLLENHAAHDEIVQFLNAAADATRDRCGDSYYALLVWHCKDRLQPNFSDDGISWPRTRQGFLDFGRACPQSSGARNAFAALAHRAKDDGLAHALLNRMGSAWETDEIPTRKILNTLERDVSQARASIAESEIPFHPALVERPIPAEWLSQAQRSYELNAQANELMIEEIYPPLDDVAAELRDQAPWFSKSGRSLHDFYGSFKLGDYFDEGQCRSYLDSLQRWGQAMPRSVTQHVALGTVLIEYAWRARGSGYANTVTDEGWRLFGERLTQARTALEAGLKLRDDPQLYAELGTVALGQSWSAEEREKLYRDAIGKFPLYIPIYKSRVVSLMPRWSGEPGDMERFAEDSARGTQKQLGMAMYALLAECIYPYETSDFFKHTRFKWPLIREGIHDLLARPGPLYSPRILLNLNWLAWMSRDSVTQLQCLRAVSENDLLQINSSPFAAHAEIDGVANGSFHDLEDEPLTATISQAGTFSWDSLAPRLLESTDRVAIRDGAEFGIIVKLNRCSYKPHTIRFVTDHPAYQKPDGKVETQAVSEQKVDEIVSPYLLNGLFYFSTNAPWEWVPGDYTCTAFIDGHKLAEKKFQVYKE